MTEQTLRIDRDTFSIPATLTIPPVGGDAAPAVLLLHGTGSHKDEVGGMFARLAVALTGLGVVSVRIDFAGCGDSDRPQTEFTVESELADALAAYRWLTAQPVVDPSRVFVVGFSQGGLIASLLVATSDLTSPPAGLVTWSSGDISGSDRDAAFAASFDEGAPDALIDMGFAQFRFSRHWWDQFRTADVRAAIGQYFGPVLAISGSDDETVRPQASIRLLEAAAGHDLSLVQMPGADHIFNVLAEDGSDASSRAINLTAEWIGSRAFARSRAESTVG